MQSYHLLQQAYKSCCHPEVFLFRFIKWCAAVQLHSRLWKMMTLAAPLLWIWKTSFPNRRATSTRWLGYLWSLGLYFLWIGFREEGGILSILLPIHFAMKYHIREPRTNSSSSSDIICLYMLQNNYFFEKSYTYITYVYIYCLSDMCSRTYIYVANAGYL